MSGEPEKEHTSTRSGTPVDGDSQPDQPSNTISSSISNPADTPIPDANDANKPAMPVSSDSRNQLPTTIGATDNASAISQPSSRLGPFANPDTADTAGDGIGLDSMETDLGDQLFLDCYGTQNFDLSLIDEYTNGKFSESSTAVPVSGLEHVPAPSDMDLNGHDLTAFDQFMGDMNQLGNNHIAPNSDLNASSSFLYNGDTVPHSLACTPIYPAEQPVHPVPNDNGASPDHSTALESNPSFQLFCSDNEEPGPEPAGKKAPKKTTGPTKQKTKKRLGPTKLSAGEKRQKLIEAYNFSQQKPQGVKKSRKPRVRRKENLNIDTLFGWNTIEAAKASRARAKENGHGNGGAVANAAAPNMPLGFTSKARGKAIAEMISQVPGLDKTTAAIDKRAISEACTLFNKSPRADGNGGWLHSDMNTGLFHYQLLGVGFMRNRENSHAAPHGGFLCDDMGFGKTIQAIANIVDGKPGDDDIDKTTLIVAPPHLVSHWRNEVVQHAKKKSVGMVVVHHAAHRLDDDMIEQLVESGILGILITTYGEVRRSWPEVKQSPGSAIGKDLQTMYDNHCGILHRMRFRRIILDEGHEIKNHGSKTSRAVRMLSGRYRWVITGTPIHNTVEEFFPYFDFLKIPQTGTIEQFRQKYNPDDEVDRENLQLILKAYMLRRTHEDTIFGHPILSMPDIGEKTFSIKFCKAERYLYRELTLRCVRDLFDLAQKKEGDDIIFRSYFTLLLRLRMCTSHVLVASEKALKKLLSRETIRAIRAEIADEAEPEDLETCYIYEKLIRGEKLPTFDEIQRSRPPGNGGPIEYSPKERALITQFRTNLNAKDSTDQSCDMTTCRKCKSEPFDGYIMSCMHVTCYMCFLTLNRKKKRTETKCGCGEMVTGFAFYRVIDSLRDEIPTKTTPPGSSTVLTGADIEQKDFNWVDAAGHLMQGAKLKAIRSCVLDWFSKSCNAKVVIFTQFLDMVRVLSAMCETEGWGYTTLTGKTAPSEREKDIKQYRDDPSTRILIGSLRAGGTGLNLTMATRCILVDLWWNEAIEQQAFCRLYRIGQEKGVEFVRLTVQNSIDDRLQRIQRTKADTIDKTMGPDVISARETLLSILDICGLEEDTGSERGFTFVADDDENNDEDGDGDGASEV